MEHSFVADMREVFKRLAKLRHPFRPFTMEPPQEDGARLLRDLANETDPQKRDELADKLDDRLMQE